ncbi:MAG: hypothetical protein CL608_24310 [Anaerolineaceae bacterium]|nr:hypothetical protein [Anaerolineaceae bacterium]
MNKRTVLIGGMVLVLLGLLAGGAYTAVQLLSTQKDGSVPDGTQVSQGLYESSGGNPVAAQTILVPASELPDEEASTVGIFLRQEDNSYFVGTGNTSIDISVENNEPSVATGHSGPEVEVVANRDTIFYEDITEIDPGVPDSPAQELVQLVRQVEPPTDLPRGSSMRVWGERRSDRVVATIVLFVKYQLPPELR